ncbi:hypothetical protein [Streptomyces pinistramenti]|uniref:hypothetical protein n=1 Tax=Streptomyces pinistramenti TaxID=2884812 RepID=UPI001D090DD3|nr:hypothetical protein [Streptomyces pinistramenti]MCB5909717.1 hypothetical protein [Streptomyces pinistramenti]
MSHAFYSDAAEKIRTELTQAERVAVETVCRSLEEDPKQGRGLPDADPGSESYVVEPRPEQTGGRGISVIYRHRQDKVMILHSPLILRAVRCMSSAPAETSAISLPRSSSNASRTS